VKQCVEKVGAEDDWGEPFMAQYHPLKSLAPRDIVARAIDTEMKKAVPITCCWTSTHRPAEFVRDRFPQHLRDVLEVWG
jgi:L-aspartate oxidase